jgi:hypothetical protein
VGQIKLEHHIRISEYKEVVMNRTSSILSERMIGPLKAIGYLLKEMWNTAESCGFCCGVRLDREPRPEEMPTPSSCCGVRV